VWAFTLGVAAFLVVLCVAQHLPTLLVPEMEGPAPEDLPAEESSMSATPTAAAPDTPHPTPRADAPLASSTQDVTPSEPVRLTVVYDNNPFDDRLRTAWGFACWIEVGGVSVLFDTGADGPTLLGNLATLGFDPDEIDIVVLSHNHDDHTGGLQALLEVNGHLTVYMPQSFPEASKAAVRVRGSLMEVGGLQQIADRVWTLGEMGPSPIEQALIVHTRHGVILITGCAHPGIVAIARAARDVDRIRLIIGGFHLGGKDEAEIQAIITQLRELGVEGLAPCHCTGDQAMQRFEETWGEAYVSTGVGTVIDVP